MYMHRCLPARVLEDVPTFNAVHLPRRSDPSSTTFHDAHLWIKLEHMWAVSIRFCPMFTYAHQRLLRGRFWTRGHASLHEALLQEQIHEWRKALRPPTYTAASKFQISHPLIRLSGMRATLAKYLGLHTTYAEHTWISGSPFLHMNTQVFSLTRVLSNKKKVKSMINSSRLMEQPYSCIGS